MIDQTLLRLPPWRGPAFHVDSLERVAQRETCRLGIRWTDLSPRERNGWMDWAQGVLSASIEALIQDTEFTELASPAAMDRHIIGCPFGVDELMYWVVRQHHQWAELARWLGKIRDALEGRER